MPEIPDIVNHLLRCILCQENMRAMIWAFLYNDLSSLWTGSCIFSYIPLISECLEVLNSRWLNISINLQHIELITINYTYLSLKNSTQLLHFKSPNQKCELGLSAKRGCSSWYNPPPTLPHDCCFLLHPLLCLQIDTPAFSTWHQETLQYTNNPPSSSPVQNLKLILLSAKRS